MDILPAEAYKPDLTETMPFTITLWDSMLITPPPYVSNPPLPAELGCYYKLNVSSKNKLVNLILKNTYNNAAISFRS